MSSSQSSNSETQESRTQSGDDIEDSHDSSGEDDENERHAEMPKGSVIWDYFKRSENERAICNYCLREFKVPQGTTTCLFNHLKAKHSKFWEECEEKNHKRQQTNNAQRKRSKTQMSSSEKKEMDRAVMEYIALDMHSYSSIEGRGFQRLLKKTTPEYDIPHRTTFSRTIGPNLYNEVKSNLMEELHDDLNQGVMSISLTTDGWTSRSGNKYLSLTLHYLTKDFTMKNIMLDLQETVVSQTAANLRDCLRKMMDQWGLSEYSHINTFFVTDNAHNITAAIAGVETWQNIFCFAHTLQLVLKDARKYDLGLDELLKKARRIATHFHHSASARHELHHLQKNSDDCEEPLSIVQMVETRWNTEYLMLERMDRLKGPLSQILANNVTVDGLTGREWKTIQELLRVMEPLYEATVISCGNKYPTLSMVIPMIQGIQRTLNIIQEEDNLELITKQYVKMILEFIEVRFENVLTGTLYAKCTFLDPRYKNFFFDDDQLKKIEAELITEIKNFVLLSPERVDPSSSIEILIPTSSINNSVTSFNHQQVRKKRPTLLDFMINARPNPHQQADSELSKEIENELVAYKHGLFVDPYGDPIAWWKSESSKYSRLSLMARKYLLIPGTEVESERLFSSAGDVVNEKRTSLLPESVQCLVFLNHNL